ncbi:hypothetical protein BKA67DRAFT_82357 [Truncatella angustata]|uniref:Uncharacterized protein n=1 Tax=Truncatella angustata TaxID=152316 RepID=A0A9P8V073_9PEZI|nr:uncharacterized protein BKA67DRAFT_82357 [Truncatella angustata]KAH6661335.1 hypothetical protein BKA67DRAFT_82357 [Truncatella angustata]
MPCNLTHLGIVRCLNRTASTRVSYQTLSVQMTSACEDFAGTTFGSFRLRYDGLLSLNQSTRAQLSFCSKSSSKYNGSSWADQIGISVPLSTRMAATLTVIQKNILAMSKAEYLSHIGNYDYETKLQVAAAIFKVDVQSSRPSILLLKRKRHGIHSPALFEVPNGNVNDDDFIISDSIARAVSSLVDLKVFRINAMLREKRWVDRQYSWMDDDDHTDLTSLVNTDYLQLNWAVAVSDIGDVAVKSDEHEEYVWATWNALGMLNLRDETRDLAKEALTWAARRLC